jgi:hypothetical protein
MGTNGVERAKFYQRQSEFLAAAAMTLGTEPE